MPPSPEIDTRSLDARLAALAEYRILDTDPEQGFDDIVTIACQLCGTPVGLVSLVEKDRQWFKARVGFGPSETPIGQSVCAHAISGHETLIIPDLTKDDRTKDNTLVTEPPHIRFYAGAPLITPAGIAIGTLCVIDTEPRAEGLKPSQVSALEALARQVMTQFELRRTNFTQMTESNAATASARKETRTAQDERDAIESVLHELRVSQAALRLTEERLRLAVEASGSVGIYDWDIAADRVSANAHFAYMYSVAPALAESGAPISAYLDGIHPSDRNRVGDEINAVLAAGGDFRSEYRLLAGNGTTTWVLALGRIGKDEYTGKVSRLAGIVLDITARKADEARQSALLRLGELLRDNDEVRSIASSAAQMLAELLGASRAGFGFVDLAQEIVDMQPDWCAPGIASVTGRHRFRDYGSFIDELKGGEIVIIADVTTHPKTAAVADALLGLGIRVLINVPIMEQGRLASVVFIHYDRLHPFSGEDLAFLRTVADRTQAAVSRARAIQQQKLLNQELSHRMKNTLAMVQAIATQTLRHLPDRDVVSALEKRLQALGTAHDLLLRQSWTSASMRAVIVSVIEAVGQTGRVEIKGPDVQLGARSTMSLSLLVHELTTNAIKYGALSVSEGRVQIRWDLSQDDVLALHWREHGGPAPERQARRGFGSRLINMGLVGTGGVELRYDHSGFEADMTAPLAQVQES